MRRFRLLGLMILLSGVALLAVALAGGAAPTTTPAMTTYQAITTARAVLGLTDMTGVAASATRITMKGDRSPFVHNEIGGKVCYLVAFDNVQIKMPDGEGEAAEQRTVPIHDFRVAVEASTGKVLRIWSAEWLDPPTARRSIAEIEAKLDCNSHERWDGIATTVPKVPLLEAMRRNDVGLGVEQLDVWYVMYKGAPTWIVLARSQIGGTAMDRREQTDPYPIYGWRTGINADTGRPVFAGNIY